ncbi:hypothetical protein RHDC4_00346 [Rhodocyclaceae bacterium]|nr:hypothetical protein RHDC4_00346 [Rhodocyclaceae bacterium]
MSALFWISVAANIMMALALVAMVRWNRSATRSAKSWASHQAAEIERRDRWLEQLHADSCALAEAVAVSLEAIRQDIDRNYHHTHDGHVLDVLAHRLCEDVDGRGGVSHIRVDEWLAEKVRAAGGQVSDGAMSLGQMLAFAWHQHAMARERADQLIEVVRQPCGTPYHAEWWGKTLAIYELMCDRDKDAAVSRMLAVANAWKHEPGFAAARYAEDIR